MVAICGALRATEHTPVDPGYETVEWRRRQVLFPDWTPSDLDAHRENVEVYSNCEEVELMLNGKSLGVKPLPSDARPRNWDVEFEPGVLTARPAMAARSSPPPSSARPAKPAKIRLSTDAKKLGPRGTTSPTSRPKSSTSTAFACPAPRTW